MPVHLHWFGEGMPPCLSCKEPTQNMCHQWEIDGEHGWLCEECCVIEYKKARELFLEKQKSSLTITINNLSEAQKIAIEDLMATWVSLGSMGGSRWTSFFADGDGDFRPNITVNYLVPKFFDKWDRKNLWKSGDYQISPNRVSAFLSNPDLIDEEYMKDDNPGVDAFNKETDKWERITEFVEHNEELFKEEMLKLIERRNSEIGN